MEKALQEANPDWSVRRAFTAQIIINHVQARDGEKIDNVEQALNRAVENGVKNLVVQPTHLMHGAEYDELVEALDSYKDKFETVTVAEPLLGEVGDDAAVVNEDKAAVAEAITAEAVKTAGFDSLEAAKEDGTAFVFMGHGTSHTAKVSYSQMATQMEKLGYDNVFIGTVEGEPEETACENVIAAVKEAGYTKVILRPLMVVAGDPPTTIWLAMMTIPGRASLLQAVTLKVLTARSQDLAESMLSSRFMQPIQKQPSNPSVLLCFLPQARVKLLQTEHILQNSTLTAACFM